MIVALLVGCQSSDVSRTLGARCDSNSDCDQKCLTGGNWPGGLCTVVCDMNNLCPSGAACIAESGGVCAYSCAMDRDCVFLGAGYTCQLVDSLGGTKVSACRG